MAIASRRICKEWGMILGVEIGLIIMGIIALSAGRLYLSPRRVVRGGPARALGIVAMLPMPVNIALGYFVGLVAVAQGNTLDLTDGPTIVAFTAMEAVVTGLCAAVISLVGWSLAAHGPVDADHVMVDPDLDPVSPADRPRSSRQGDAWALGGTGTDRALPTSGKAIASLILGILTPFLAFLPSIPALWLGIHGLIDIDRSRGRLRGMPMAIIGVILGGLGTFAALVLLALLPMMIGIASAARGRPAPVPSLPRTLLKSRPSPSPPVTVARVPRPAAARPTAAAPPGRASRRTQPAPEDEPSGGFARSRGSEGLPGTTPTPRARRNAPDDELTPTPTGGRREPRPAAEPRATGESLEGEARTEADLRVTRVNLPAGQLPHCLFWSADGLSFYTAEKTGVIRRISRDGFREERRLDAGTPCTWLSPSAEGLLLTASALQEVWLLDPATLQVKGRIGVPSVDRCVSSPALSVAFAVGRRFTSGGLSVVDLKAKAVVRQYSGREFEGAGAGFAHPAVTPDGRFLFTQGGIEQLQRFRIRGDRLEYQESSERIAQNGKAIEISPDGYYVALPSGGGNYGGRPYSTNIYKVTDLSTPTIVVESGAYPEALGFDIKAGLLYAQNHEFPLIVFGPTGLKHKEYKLARRGGGSAQQFLVDPAGRTLLVLTEKSLDLVQLPEEG
jgi:hypothetical protein